MRTIHFFKGIPGCGKSTEALKMLEEHPDRYRRVNKDSIRTMLIGPRVAFYAENMVENIQSYCMEIALEKGFDVICDNTNLKDKYYYEACAVAKRVGDVQIIERYFDVPLEECLKRNKGRPNPVPDNVIIGMWEKNIRGKVISPRTEYFPPVIKIFEKDPNLPDAILADVDGTLAINSENRSYYDFTRVLEDSVNVPVANVLKTYKQKGVTIIIVSGRDDSCKIDTETWLKCNDIPYDFIYMRVTGDKRKDNVLKEEIFNKHIKGKFNILFVLDDRQKVVNAWREMGLTCFQVNNGNF
jgi:tRNA uridine 5-carbamoylmethylation protein Kti12